MANGNNESKKPEDSDFKQQRLRAWQPLLTPKWVIGTFSVVGILFIIIGAVVLQASQDVVEVEYRYDNSDLFSDDCDLRIGGDNCTATITIEIPETMKDPVFMYYKLTNYYQNHRRYVKSRSDPQLADGGGATANCDPLEKWGEDGKTLYPCGLIANSMFNDTFTGFTIDGQPVEATNEGIAWKSDRKTKFKRRETAADEIGWRPEDEGGSDIGPGGYMPRVDSEEFMVWMRTAGLPTFKKLHRIIGTELPKGQNFQMEVTNVYPVEGFNGQKSIVLSTTSWLGGKNDFLGLAYIVVGALCLALAVAFLIKNIVSPRQLGEMSYFNLPCRPNVNH